MEQYRLSDIADIQSGLVLSRKAADDISNKFSYKRLTLRSITEDGLIDPTSIENYDARDMIEPHQLTKEKDIIIRLYSPVRATVIKKEFVDLVVPSQLAIIRLKENSPFIPGYLCVYLSNEKFMKSVIEDAGMSAQKIIKVGSIAKIEIPQIPIEKQKIASLIYEKQLDIIDLYNQIIDKEVARTNAIIKDIIGGKI